MPSTAPTHRLPPEESRQIYRAFKKGDFKTILEWRESGKTLTKILALLQNQSAIYKNLKARQLRAWIGVYLKTGKLPAQQKRGRKPKWIFDESKLQGWLNERKKAPEILTLLKQSQPRIYKGLSAAYLSDWISAHTRRVLNPK